MSLEDVTVSLSRLALAKAIKTPDTEEQDAEPWTKSVIFYQSHIDEQMREQLANPNAKRRTARPMSTQLLPKPKRPQQDIKRHSYNQLQQQIQQYKQQPQRTSASSESRSSLSSGKLVQNHKPGHRYVPSDDDESEDDKEEDDDEDDEEEDDDHKVTVAKPTITTTLNDRPMVAKPTITTTLNDRPMVAKSTISTTLNDRPIITKPTITTTLSDTAIDKKGKSKSHLIAPSDDEDEEEEEEEEEESEESDDDDQKETYARRMSTLKRLELGNSIHRRTKSTNDVMNLPSPSAFMEPVKVDPIDQWRMTVLEADDISTPNSSNSSTSPVEQPSTSTTSLSSKSNNVNNRRSTMSEMDMMYLQQHQQQQMYNMQLQQAMQYQQAQQMMQIQQYQQALQMQQQQQQYRSSMMLDPNRATKQNNRRSVSAMDLMLQMEKEKASFRKNNKKKIPDPSKAKLSTGLLSTVPVQGLHNINFQEYVLKQKRSSPTPTMSMSTPIGYQPSNNNRQSQYLMPQQQQQQQHKRTSNLYRA